MITSQEKLLNKDVSFIIRVFFHHCNSQGDITFP